MGRKHEWSDTSNAAIYLDLEAAAAQGIRIQEFVSGQTSPSIEVESNAAATVFRVLASATDSDAMELTASVTTGKGFDLVANSLTTGAGLQVNSSATAITGAGRLVDINHTGATSTSGVLVEISSAAADETVVMRVTASAALAAGVLVDLSAAAMTTGTALDIGGLDALTTGKGVNVVSNSTNTGAFVLCQLTNDNATATGAIPLSIQQDAANEAIFVDQNADGQGIFIDHDDTGTAYSIEVDRDGNNAADIYGMKIACDNAGAGAGAGIDLSSFAAGEITINFPDGSASSIDPSATAESGWINIAVAGTVKYVPYYAAS